MDDVQNGLNKRNTLAFEQLLKELTAKVHEQDIILASLNNTIAMLLQRMSDLEQNTSIMKAISSLRGPTVKE